MKKDLSELNYHLDFMHSDDLVEFQIPEKNEFGKGFNNLKVLFNNCSTQIKLPSEFNYLYTGYVVSGQVNSCKLTSPSVLPEYMFGLYFVDTNLSIIYAKVSSLATGVQSCVYSHYGKSRTATFSEMSVTRFNTARPYTPKSQDNFVRVFDTKLQGRFKSNGANVNHLDCAHVCLDCGEAYVTSFFCDQAFSILLIKRERKMCVVIFLDMKILFIWTVANQNLQSMQKPLV
jgi:hypothetical protein